MLQDGGSQFTKDTHTARNIHRAMLSQAVRCVHKMIVCFQSWTCTCQFVNCDTRCAAHCCVQSACTMCIYDDCNPSFVCRNVGTAARKCSHFIFCRAEHDPATATRVTPKSVCACPVKVFFCIANSAVHMSSLATMCSLLSLHSVRSTCLLWPRYALFSHCIQCC